MGKDKDDLTSSCEAGIASATGIATDASNRPITRKRSFIWDTAAWVSNRFTSLPDVPRDGEDPAIDFPLVSSTGVSFEIQPFKVQILHRK